MLVEAKLVEQLQSIAVFEWQETTENINYFRSNPLLQPRKQSLRNNTFALRKNGKNEKQFVRTENSAEVRSRFLFLPVHMNFSRWQVQTCEEAEPTIFKLRVCRQEGHRWKALGNANRVMQPKRLLSVELKELIHFMNKTWLNL